MQTITSAHNPRFKAACRLHTARARRQQNRIIIDGQREALRAAAGPVVLHEVYLCRELLEPSLPEQLADSFQPSGATLLEVPLELYGRLAYGQRRDGVVAVAYRPDTSLEQLALAQHPLVVVVESVEKPGNLGAVVRTADAAAVDAVIVADGHTDVFHPNAIRASIGCVFTVPLAVAPSIQVQRWLARRQFEVFSATTEAATAYTDVNWAGRRAVVLGSETTGLSDVWQQPGIRAVQIPMRGQADSLNLSTAAAIIIFEAVRQRQQQGNSAPANPAR